MRLNDVNFKLISYHDPSGFGSKLGGLNWNAYTFRQERYKDHSQTFTVPLIWSEKFNSIQYHSDYLPFKEVLDPIFESIRSVLGEGLPITAILINLPAGTEIGRHRDANPIGERFNECHRLHYPILTNDDCIFEIDGEERNLKSGELWEINNVSKLHSVRNVGESDRIHLLIDWMPLNVFKRFLD